MASVLGSVEIAKPYGGDLSLTPQGDLAIVQDTIDTPSATIQRLQHLALTSPRIPDGRGGYLPAFPDDLFNPDYGAGLATSVGEPVTPALLQAIQTRVSRAISTDPTISPIPPPIVNVTDLGNGAIQLDISATAITGQVITVPSLAMKGLGI